jgi:type I restriction enzyme S subunit
MRDGWTETTLGEVVNIQKGKKPPAIDAYEEFSRPYLTADVLRGAPCEQFVSGALVGSCVQLSGHEAVLLWDGAGAGDVFRSQPGILASTMAKVESKNFSSIDNGYLYLYLDTKRIEIKSSCRGTTVPHVSPEALKSLNFSLPPLVAQKRIVDVVSSVDTYIDALQKQADTARTARNAVLHELLSAGGDGWTETTLGDVVTINPEAVKGLAQDDEIVYVDLSSVSAESGISADLYRGAFGEAPGRARRVIRFQDVLVSTVRPYLKGFALVPANLDGGIASTGFAVLRADPKKVLSGFIWATVGLNNFVDYLMDRATGSSYPAVRPDDVASFELSLPPLGEQKRIVEIVSSMDDVIQTTEKAFAEAKNLRSGLLSDLLSGEHEIPASYDSLLGAA